MSIIGITGYAGAGKSTVAHHLVDRHGYTRVRFAGPLKAMMAALGLSYEEIDGHLKEVPCAKLGGKTPRFAMQTLGTEWGRDLISSSLWTDAWRREVMSNICAGRHKIVVDDMRFENEAALIYGMPLSAIIHIDREGRRPIGRHVSEAGGLPHNVIFKNNGSIDALLAKVDAWLS